MTPDERQLLADLAAKIAQTPPPERDPDAESFIRSHIGNRPDALYLMTQTVLIQNLALDQARQQIQQLQQQTAGAGSGRKRKLLGWQRPAGGRPGSGIWGYLHRLRRNTIRAPGPPVGGSSFLSQRGDHGGRRRGRDAGV